MKGLTFAQPLWFWAFAIFPFFLALAFAGEQARAAAVRKLVAARLEARLAGTVNSGLRWFRFVLLLLGLASVVVALARPQWGFTWEEAKRRGRDVLIAIDTSRSMLADDVKPSRLARAKLAAENLIGQLQGDRVGVIAFAGTAFLQAPLTVDYGAVMGALKELDTEIIPQGGTNLEGALHAAAEAFGKGESEHRALIIFSDGEELDADAQKALEKLKDQVRVFAVGVGSPEGALIPIKTRYGGPEFVQDQNGNFVKSRLDETRLRAIAEATGGFYLRLTTGRAEMEHIVRDGLGKMTEHDIDARLSRKPIERFEWPLSAALVLIAASMLLGERKRVRAMTAAAMTLFAFLPAQADAKNSGVEAYDRKDYETARKEFAEQIQRRPSSSALHFDLGAAAYKAGDHDMAMAEFSKALEARDPQLRSKAAYNLANTLFQRGAAQKEKPAKLAEWKNAIQHYDEALRVNPEDENATYNRDVVRKLIEDLEKEQKQDQQQQDKKDQKQDQKQDQKDQKDQQQKDQQQQDKGGQQDQKDQQKPQSGNGQKDQQDQQQQQQGKDGQQGDKQQQDQKKDGQQQKDQQGKDGQKPQQDKQDGSDGSQQQMKDGQKGDEKKKDGSPQSGDQRDEKREQGQKPQPGEPPPQPEKKKEGELKSAPQGAQAGQGDQGQDDAAEAAAEAQAAAEGKMTPQQARALLESLKGEDDKVRLVDPRERSGVKRVLKDW